MKHALRITTAAVAVVAALGSLSACGGHSAKAAGGNGSSGGNAPAVSPLAALRAAVAKTTQAQSSKISGTTTTISGTTTTAQMTITMNGSLDWSSGTQGSVAIKMAGQAASSTAQFGDNGVIQARYTPDAMYMNMGDAIAKADGGKPWVKYSYDALAKSLGASGDVLKQQFQNNNPTRSVQLLIASGDVKSLGSATVNGTRTTHYAGTLDVNKLLGTAPGLSAATVKGFKAQMKQQGVTGDHIDLWVDGKGLLIKKVEKITMATGTTNSTVYYSDFGVKVNVTAPPAAQTVDFSQLMAKQGK